MNRVQSQQIRSGEVEIGKASHSNAPNSYVSLAAVSPTFALTHRPRYSAVILSQKCSSGDSTHTINYNEGSLAAGRRDLQSPSVACYCKFRLF